MPHHYLNPDDADNPYRLPNIEVFAANYGECENCRKLYIGAVLQKGQRVSCTERECREDEHTIALSKVGWFYWYCVPGCLPDGEAEGPFDTEELALADARRDASTEFD
jgi:hypothetical protein